MQLVENKGAGYNVVLNIDRTESKFLVIKNLEELKQDYASYLKQYPKDCDYIILDLIKHEVYIVELKTPILLVVNLWSN